MNAPTFHIRPENERDADGIRSVNEEAFGRANEAELVEALRPDSAFIPELSLIAAEGERVLGHCLFTRASVDGQPGECGILALGPIAVLPELQRRGIGAALIEEGLRRAAGLGFRGVILIGHPTYYPRFGFRPAKEFGLTCEFEVPEDVFMALPLAPEGFRGIDGRILFAPPFRNV